MKFDDFLPIDKKIRLVGILKENRINTGKNFESDLLYVLFFDFEHIRYPSNKEKDVVKEEDLFCIMKKRDCKVQKEK